ncbi:hypothetical protein C2G38_2187683 [Gigaspora rosea]|uniref:Meiotic expression up-regulated protein 6 PH domain-containing protein n=1 Tax=Gigaspora rosea TaxID=44941 RepID=A0A397V5W6_9GLOM|nr:hypothetical protein C2G38_2187683 [Gigaspora rosea]
MHNFIPPEPISEGWLFKHICKFIFGVKLLECFELGEAPIPEDKLKNNKIFFCNIAHATQTSKGLLFYYQNENLKEKQMPSGIINLKGVVCEDIGQNKFKIIAKNGKEYVFEAPNKEFKRC